MKIAWFSHNDGIQYASSTSRSWWFSPAIRCLRASRRRGRGRIPLADAALLAPVIPRSKVFCVGKNYHDYAVEMDGRPPPNRCCS